MEVQLEEMMDVRESARFESDTEVKMFEVYQTGDRGGPQGYRERPRSAYFGDVGDLDLEPKPGSLQWTSTCK